MFWSDNPEKSDQKSILSWRCHEFKRKRRYNKWNFVFFRLECERWQHLHQCFETLIAFWSLFVCSNTTLLEFQTLLFLFFSKICASKLGVRLIYGCGLYTDVYGSKKNIMEQSLFLASHFHSVWNCQVKRHLQCLPTDVVIKHMSCVKAKQSEANILSFVSSQSQYWKFTHFLEIFAGTPVAGHTDNLSRLRELCTQNGLWLHLEG